MNYDRPGGTGPKSVFDTRYEILEIVGRGRNSVVYKAALVSDNVAARKRQSGAAQTAPTPQVVALKVLTGNSKHPTANILRMKRESIALLSCASPHVVRILDYVSTGDLCYLSMEYAEGRDLRGILEAYQEVHNELLPLETALRWIAQMLIGLQSVHRAGIIHRDIKPENLLLDADGNIKVADFGIALLPTETVSPDEALRGVGTLEYLAPEYLEHGMSDAQTDLYSVGVTAFQILTAALPFRGETLSEQISSKMQGKRRTLSEFRSDIPRGLNAVLNRAMAPDPRIRLRTVDEFIVALAKVAPIPELEPYLAAAKKSVALLPPVTRAQTQALIRKRYALALFIRKVWRQIRNFWNTEENFVSGPQMVFVQRSDDRPRLSEPTQKRS